MKYHQYIYYYIPTFFALKTRFLKRSRWGLIVWCSEYLIPVLLAMIIQRWGDFSFMNSALAILAVYNYYEIGYIQNDCETIKKEIKPTLRLSKEDLDYYEQHKIDIYFFRIIIGVFCTSVFLYNDLPIIYIIGLWSILPIYYLYNTIRGRINLYFIVILTTFRFCYPLLLYGGNDYFNIPLLLVIFFSYPFPTFIIQCVEGKYGKSEKWALVFFHNYDDRFLFRVKYYFIISLVITILCVVSSLSWLLCIIPYYYLVTRTSQLKMSRLGPK